MTYKLIKSSLFLRKAKKILKKNPELIPKFRDVLIKLQNDPMHPELKSHKLKGILSGSFACSLTYDIRIIFDIKQNYIYKNEVINVIFLQTIGTHDEVY